MVRTRLVLGLAGVVSLLGVGCGDSSSSTDMAQSLPSCTAGAKDCVTDHVARVCASDGTWVPVQCRVGELCSSGDCIKDPNPACTSAEDTCKDDSTALRCSAAAKGFDVVMCPAGTTCAGPGLCQGLCIVGSSRCAADGSVEKCVDGKGYTTVACAATERCVSTATSPYAIAECKAAECTPSTNGCDYVCGNKATPGAAGQEGYLSVCSETPAGYKWVAIQCPAGQSCSPTGTNCTGGQGGTQAICASDCHPGDTRCASLIGDPSGDAGIQTCGPDGKWGVTVTTCNPDPANGGKVCFGKPGDSAHVVCGSPACSLAKGSCDGAGKFHACDDNGMVSATGVGCATGVCTQTGTVSGPSQPGACVPQCKPTEERCLGGASYQTCTAALVWGAAQNCANDKACLDYQTEAGLAAKACGDCAPGSTKCTDENGDPGDGYVQTCGADATWGTPSACAVGVCLQMQWNFFAMNAGCIASCVPNTEVCLGGQASLPGLAQPGTDSHGTCTADGKFPDETLCDAGTMCRRNAGGQALGCVPCVGVENESGMPDTRCVDSLGDPGNTHVQTCKPDSTGWQGVATLLECTSSSCVDATSAASVPIPTTLGTYCHPADGFDGSKPATGSLLATYGEDCSYYGWWDPNTVPCPLPGGGSVSDCCELRCYADQLPSPAMCSL